MIITRGQLNDNCIDLVDYCWTDRLMVSGQDHERLWLRNAGRPTAGHGGRDCWRLASAPSGLLQFWRPHIFNFGGDTGRSAADLAGTQAEEMKKEKNAAFSAQQPCRVFRKIRENQLCAGATDGRE